MTVQLPTFRCEGCGNPSFVMPGRTPWLFDVNCPCGREYVLAWATEDPPPEFFRGIPMNDEIVKRLNDTMEKRVAEYGREVMSLRYEFPDGTIPAQRIEMLLMEAYRDGGRDMYEAVNETLAPLWKQAGITP